MKEKDIIWKLNHVRNFLAQGDLYIYLNKSDHLKDAEYLPSEFKQQNCQKVTKIQNKIFERVSFSKTNISKIIFRNCKFDHCLFIGSELNNCEFHNCEFVLTNTYKILIFNTYIDPKSFKQCLNEKKHQNIGVHLYQVLLNNSRSTHQIEFERAAHFLFLRWKRLQDGYEIAKLQQCPVLFLFQKKCLKYCYWWAWEILFGFGLRLRIFLRTVFGIIVLFSTINYYLRSIFGLMQGSEIVSSYMESFYFTIISLTTVGYGDITPTTQWGRIFASFQSIIGFCLFAMLASMLFRRMSP